MAMEPNSENTPIQNGVKEKIDKIEDQQRSVLTQTRRDTLPNANLEDRVQQEMIREIRDGNLSPEEKKAMYEKLDPVMKRSVVDPMPIESVSNESVLLQKKKDELARVEQEYMDYTGRNVYFTEVASQIEKKHEKLRKEILEMEKSPLETEADTGHSSFFETPEGNGPDKPRKFTKPFEIPVKNNDKGKIQLKVNNPDYDSPPHFVEDNEADEFWNEEKKQEKMNSRFRRPKLPEVGDAVAQRKKLLEALDEPLTPENPTRQINPQYTIADLERLLESHHLGGDVSDIVIEDRDLFPRTELPMTEKVKTNEAIPFTVSEAINYLKPSEITLPKLIREYREGKLSTQESIEVFELELSRVIIKTEILRLSGLKFENHTPDAKKGYAVADFLENMKALIKLADECRGERKTKRGGVLTRTNTEFFKDLDQVSAKIAEDLQDFH